MTFRGFVAETSVARSTPRTDCSMSPAAPARRRSFRPVLTVAVLAAGVLGVAGCALLPHAADWATTLNRPRIKCDFAPAAAGTRFTFTTDGEVPGLVPAAGGGTMVEYETRGDVSRWVVEDRFVRNGRLDTRWVTLTLGHVTDLTGLTVEPGAAAGRWVDLSPDEPTLLAKIAGPDGETGFLRVVWVPESVVADPAALAAAEMEDYLAVRRYLAGLPAPLD